jgi:hypothetical protein
MYAARGGHIDAAWTLLMAGADADFVSHGCALLFSLSSPSLSLVSSPCSLARCSRQLAAQSGRGQSRGPAGDDRHARAVRREPQRARGPRQT